MNVFQNNSQKGSLCKDETKYKLVEHQQLTISCVFFRLTFNNSNEIVSSIDIWEENFSNSRAAHFNKLDFVVNGCCFYKFFVIMSLRKISCLSREIPKMWRHVELDLVNRKFNALKHRGVSGNYEIQKNIKA